MGSDSLPTNARHPLVAVIGDARLEAGSSKEAIAEQIGTALVDAGCRVLTGGLGGVMEAASRGARRSASYMPGDTIGVLPGTDPMEANPFVDIAIPTGLNHVRNTIVAQSDAVIAIGGGAGTLAEIAFAWMYRRLIIALRVDGWSGRLADTRIDERTRYPEIAEDRVFGAVDAAAALELVRLWLPRYDRRHRGIKPRGTPKTGHTGTPENRPTELNAPGR